VDQQAVIQGIGLVATSFMVAAAALWLLSKLPTSFRITDHLKKTNDDDAIVFLFEDQVLVNATKAARTLIKAPKKSNDDWDLFQSGLRVNFPELQDRLSDMPTPGNFVLHSRDGATRLRAKWHEGITRVELDNPEYGEAATSPDLSHVQAMQVEIETLRATAESAPFLVWRQNISGTITWANNTYLELAQTGLGVRDVPTWPPARLFDLTNSDQSKKPDGSRRLTTHISGEAEPRWFEIFETPIGNQSLYTAVAADKMVKAETALRDFVQTLTKTFAHLTVGLAIFDKQRRLTLFNPALMDLTSLSAGFLTARPTLQAVLDRLRDKQMVPEPKDYRSWRRRIHELEVKAADGSYEEVWPLTNGCTYRVTGRPHPDDAVALLFEDISTEIASTRRFRAELELGQSALDGVDEAIAVFSPVGGLLLANTSYSRLWNIDTTSVFAETGIVDATRTWADRCAPSPAWGDAREFVGSPGERAEWTANVQLRDGRALRCRFTPLAQGATLAGFTYSHKTDASTPTKLTEVQQLSAEIATL
jgi:PAS domain-containing protein